MGSGGTSKVSGGNEASRENLNSRFKGLKKKSSPSNLSANPVIPREKD